MTRDEAEICLQYHFPVVLIKFPDWHYEGQIGKKYYLTAFEVFLQRWSRSYKTTVMLENEDNIRTGFTVSLEEIEVAGDYQTIVNTYLKNKHAADFKNLINDMSKKGLSRPQIIDYTEKIIKEIKNEM